MAEGKEISEPTGGIPPSIFQPGTDEIIPGISGKTKLNCEIEPNRVLIRDKDNPNFIFEAEVSDNTLGLHINNKGWQKNNSEKHPDIFPAKLLEQTFAYFQKQGQTIARIQGYWTSISDNYDQYNQHLQKFSKQDITEDDKKEAAKHTWTGKQAQKYGFDEVEYVKETTEKNGQIIEITAMFKKPAPSIHQ